MFFITDCAIGLDLVGTVLALGSDLTLADDNNPQPGSSKLSPFYNPFQPGLRSVSNSHWVSPPQPDEVHCKFFFSHFVLFFTSKLVNTAMNVKKINLRSISPPRLPSTCRRFRKSSQDSLGTTLSLKKSCESTRQKLMQWRNCSLMPSTLFKGTRSTRVLLSMAHPPSPNVLLRSRTSLRDLSKTNWLPGLWWKKSPIWKPWSGFNRDRWTQQLCGWISLKNTTENSGGEHNIGLMDIRRSWAQSGLSMRDFRPRWRKLWGYWRRTANLLQLYWNSSSPSPLGSSWPRSTMLRSQWWQCSCQSLQFQSSTWNSVANNWLSRNSLSSTSGGKLGQTPRSMQLGTSAPRRPWTSVPTLTACLSHSPRLRKLGRYKDWRAQAPFPWPWTQSLQPRQDQHLPTPLAPGSLPGC